MLQVSYEVSERVKMTYLAWRSLGSLRCLDFRVDQDAFLEPSQRALYAG
jgi:hypothetical protein